MDLDAYFRRIKYTGSRRPGLFTLRALHLAHVSAVPFENLDVVLGHTLVLDPVTLERKIVHDRRGGYCFEQNSLFRDVLRAMNFEVTPLLARVRWQVPPETKTALTHMVLRVELDERPWLVDVGFGGVGSPFPLVLDTDAPQKTSHDTRRVIIRDGYLVHQLQVADRWEDVYQFRPEEPAPMDFEMGNLFSCTHPQAHFRNCLIATRVRPDGRVIIFNQDFTVRGLNGHTETRPIRSEDELLALLAEHFDLHFPAGTRFTVSGKPWSPASPT